MKKIYVVGLGPGGIDEMTPRARKAIEDSDLVVGYSTYINLSRIIFPEKSLLVQP